MNDNRQHQSKPQWSFAVVSVIGMAAYLLAWGGFHAYTVSTVLVPIMISDLLLKLSGRTSAGNSKFAMGYVAVCIAAICAGLLFSALYWPIENWLIRRRFPNGVQVGRMIAALLFFLLVWLAFPLNEAL
jgi:hypothetical protein